MMARWDSAYDDLAIKMCCCEKGASMTFRGMLEALAPTIFRYYMHNLQQTRTGDLFYQLAHGSSKISSSNHVITDYSPHLMSLSPTVPRLTIFFHNCLVLI